MYDQYGNPTRGTVRVVARSIGRSETAVRGYIARTAGANPHPLGLEQTNRGVTLDVEKTRAYAESRPKGRPAKPKGQGA